MKMKIENECKIVEDLLPNYVEELTSKETNEFIKEHMKDCNKCKKILEDMKKEITINENNEIKKDIKYLEKFKLKITKWKIIVLILIVFIVLVSIRMYNNYNIYIQIEKDSKEYIDEIQDKTDLKYNLISKNSNGEIYYTEEYLYKDNISVTRYLEDDGSYQIDSWYNKETGEHIKLYNINGIKSAEIKYDKTGDEKTIYRGNKMIPFENIYVPLWDILLRKINIEKVNGEECYVIKNVSDETELTLYRSIERGISIKINSNFKNGSESEYLLSNFSFDEIPEDQMQRPDLTGYRIFNK